MRNIEILTDTFKANGERNRWGDELGTVTVDLGMGRKVDAKAYRGSRGIAVHGFVGRYVTSTKAWPAFVSGEGSKLYVMWGRDDRSGRFNKQAGLSWEPDTMQPGAAFVAEA